MYSLAHGAIALSDNITDKCHRNTSIPPNKVVSFTRRKRLLCLPYCNLRKDLGARGLNEFLKKVIWRKLAYNEDSNRAL
jgi:hypothetical protein